MNLVFHHKYRVLIAGCDNVRILKKVPLTTLSFSQAIFLTIATKEQKRDTISTKKTSLRWY